MFFIDVEKWFLGLRVQKFLAYALAGWIPGGGKVCVFCGHRVWRFMPYRNGSSSTPVLMGALDVIGSDVDHFECPRCGSHDRERHLLMYFRACGMFEWLNARSILHFAPEKHLFQKLKSANPATYVCCDLYPKSAGTIRVDMLDMQFEAESFDLVVANHVLEHVDNVDKALAEIYRVLKPNGRAVLQTPYSAILEHTWADPGIVTAEARLQAHGQEDHVRLFGRDILDVIEASGLVSEVRQHADLLPDIDPLEFGVNFKEPFLIFRKPSFAFG